MVLYNITVNVDNEVLEDWLAWVKREHIPEIMSLGLFVDSKIYRLMQDEPQGMTYSCQFFAPDIANIMTFQSQYAQALQQKVISRYGNKVIDFRSVLEEV